MDNNIGANQATTTAYVVYSNCHGADHYELDLTQDPDGSEMFQKLLEDHGDDYFRMENRAFLVVIENGKIVHTNEIFISKFENADLDEDE